MGHFGGSSEGEFDAETENRKLAHKNAGKGEGSHMPRSRRRRVSTGTEKSMAGQLLGLSLFIMLLAFFIVLNAISTFEENKVKPVMQSLEYTFAAKIRSRNQQTSEPSLRQDETLSTQEGDTLEQLENLFAAQIPNYEAVKNRRLGMMYIQVPYEEFEKAVMAIGAGPAEGGDEAPSSSRYFLPTLVGLLKSDQAGAAYRMDMILGTGENPSKLASDSPQQMERVMAGMSRIARRIESAGIPPRLLSAGLQKEEKDMVDLVFRPHIPFNPLGNESNE